MKVNSSGGSTLPPLLDRSALTGEGRTWSFRRIGFGKNLVILLHGLGADSADWLGKEHAQALSSLDATFLAPDLPGHTPVLRSCEFQSLAEVAEGLEGLASALGYEQFGVIGYSLGGLIGLELAAQPSAQWAVLGGLTQDLANPVLRSQRAAILAHGVSAPHELSGPAECCESRRRSLAEVAHFLALPGSPLAGLARPDGRLSLLASDDDAPSAIALSALLRVAPPKRIGSNHADAFLSGSFSESAATEAARLAGAGRLSEPAGQHCLLLAGPPGVGKSAVAHVLHEAGAAHLSSDAIRRELYPEGRQYTNEESAHTYQELHARALAVLGSGSDCVVDATQYSADGHAQTASALTSAARASGHSVTQVLLTADANTLKDRIASRNSPGTRQKQTWNRSEADGSILERFLTALRPPRGFIPVANEGFFPAETARVLAPLLSGDVSPWNASTYLQSHVSLNAVGRRAFTSTEHLPEDVEQWLERHLLWQIAKDSEDGVFAAWGESSVVDSDVQAEVLRRPLMELLAGAAGLSVGRWPIVNAGLAHAYGYLLAPVMTPYGWKRDRWIDGQLPSALGADPRMVCPLPLVGTLLGNLTAALTFYVDGGSAPAFLSPAGAVAHLREQDPGTGTLAETWLVGPPQESRKRALIYSVTAPGATRRLVTAFPVSYAFQQNLAASVGSPSPLALRYNSVGAPVSDHDALRRWEWLSD